MKFLQLFFSLTIISAVCAGTLAYVDKVTKERIAAIAEILKSDAARAVMPPEVAAVEKSGGGFVGKDSSGAVAGYAFVGSSEHGYGGSVSLMVGFRPDGTVTAFRKLEANETPGLGAKLSTPEFGSQFKGLRKGEFKVRKDGGRIEAITAATITSRAVCEAVENAAALLEENGKKVE